MSESEKSREGTSSSEKKGAGDDEVTLGEVLRQQKEIEDEYEQEYLEVLGGSDDKHCTYSQVNLSLTNDEYFSWKQFATFQFTKCVLSGCHLFS